MALKGLYKTQVVTCSPETSVVEAAELMKEYGVGDVVIVEQHEGADRPVGLVTDRDIVLGAVCGHADELKTMKVEELMSPDVVTVKETESLFSALHTMKEGGVARAPVVTELGDLCGILSSSAIFRVLTEELSELVDLKTGHKEFPQQAKGGQRDSQRPSLQ